MPTVPVDDPTTSDASQNAAPGVTPAQPQDAMGQAVPQAGATIGDRIGDMLDDARTQQGLTQAVTQAGDIQSAYFQKTGQDAMDSTEPTKQAVVKAFQDQLDGLSSTIQKQMFQPVMNQYLLNMGRDIANHDLAQQRTYAIGQAQQSAASYAQLALNASDSHGQVDADGNATGDFAKYSSLMHQNVLQSGALRQLNPDSGEAQGDLRAQWSALNSAVILKKLDQGDAQGAQRVFDAAVANDRLHPQDVSMLGDTITDAASRQAVQDGVARYAALAISNADSNANGNDDTGNQHNAYGGGGDDSAADVRDDAEMEGGAEGEASAGSQSNSGTSKQQVAAQKSNQPPPSTVTNAGESDAGNSNAELMQLIQKRINALPKGQGWEEPMMFNRKYVLAVTNDAGGLKMNKDDVRVVSYSLHYFPTKDSKNGEPVQGKVTIQEHQSLPSLRGDKPSEDIFPDKIGPDGQKYHGTSTSFRYFTVTVDGKLIGAVPILDKFGIHSIDMIEIDTNNDKVRLNRHYDETSYRD